MADIDCDEKMRLQLENIFRHLADGGLLVLPGAQVLKTI